MFCDSRAERVELSPSPRIRQGTNRIQDNWWVALLICNTPEHDALLSFIKRYQQLILRKTVDNTAYEPSWVEERPNSQVPAWYNHKTKTINKGLALPSYDAPPILSVPSALFLKLCSASLVTHIHPQSPLLLLLMPVFIQVCFATLLYLLPAEALLPLWQKVFFPQAPCMACNSTCLAFIQVVYLK